MFSLRFSVPWLLCRLVICACAALLFTRSHGAETVITRLNIPTEGKVGFTLMDSKKSELQFTNVLT